MEIQKIQILKIKVSDGRREVTPEAVQKMADSISNVGLLNPITIDQEYTLIAGLHRLEAAKRLGWSEIECTVSSLEGLEATLAEIDENFIHKKLSDFEFRQLLLRRKEIYESLHPETRAGIAQAASMNKALGNNVAAPSAATSKTFVDDTADTIGMAPRTVREELQIAKNLTPEAQGIMQASGKKIRKKDTIKVSRLIPEQQPDAVRQLVSGDIKSMDEYRPPIGYYPTIRDSVADLKDPDKDRNLTPDLFLVTFTLFLQRLGQSIKSYAVNESAVVFHALTQEHLAQIQQEISSVHRALDDLFETMERKAKNEQIQKAQFPQRA